jgi:NADP-dependent 3-hydroxy acid dehydrogenase YdfG
MSDPVFLITGASTGIGAATRRHAAEAGYRVVLAARSEDKLQALAEELGGPERALVTKCDVTEWDDNAAMVRHALDAFERIDVVFANAGLRRGPRLARGVAGPLAVDGADERARRRVHDAGGAPGGQGRPRPHPHHLVGRRPGALKGSLYSCTKHAATAMAEALRQDLDGTGVRVTSIEPGMVDTPFFDKGAGDGALQADDIARAVMYAVAQPPHVDVNEMLIRPTAQPT